MIWRLTLPTNTENSGSDARDDANVENEEFENDGDDKALAQARVKTKELK